MIASTHTEKEIRRYITADSLAYLSLEGMLDATPGKPSGYCAACFSERYPIVFDGFDEKQLALFESVEVASDNAHSAVEPTDTSSATNVPSQKR